MSYACLMKKFDMYKCTIAETRHVECKDLKFKCFVNYPKASGRGYGHMLELFMVVDFPNGENNGIIYIYIILLFNSITCFLNLY